MAEIKELSYRSFDQLLDSVRIDFSAYQSQGEIDAASLIKVATRINYELGLRIYQQKETMLEINHGRAALPADFHQMVIALACYNYTHVQNSPSNGNVLLEELCPKPAATNCPCQQVLNATSNPIVTIMVNCTNITVPVTFPSGTTNVCAMSIHDPNQQLTITTNSFCYNTNTNGVYTCGYPTTCDICNVQHPGGVCPEVVINPYPLGKCRTICGGTNDQATIKILQYYSTEVFCYETFDRLWIVPNIQSDGFSNIHANGTANPNTASINGRFLETNNPNCSKVYIQYMGALEDENGGLLVLDHETINSYYSYAIKERVLENIYLNGGEDVLQRLKYTTEKKEYYRSAALNIANTPNYRDLINTISVIRANSNRQYYNTLSRYYGYLNWGGYASGVDPYNIV